MVCSFMVILGLANRFDYSEYLNACKEHGCTPESIQSFASITGKLAVSAIMFPDDSIETAYMNFQGIPPNISVVERSRGLGDTVAKITHATRLDQLAVLYTKITGKDCGCSSRQEALNKLFPYGVKEENE